MEPVSLHAAAPDPPDPTNRLGPPDGSGGSGQGERRGSERAHSNVRERGTEPLNAGLDRAGAAGTTCSVEAAGEAAHRANGEAALREQLEEARAAVGPAVEPGGHRAPAHPADRGRSSDDGRMGCTRKHEVVRSFLAAARGGVGPDRRSCCSSRVGRSSVVRCLDAGASRTWSVDALTCVLTRRSPRRIEHGVGSPACQLSGPRPAAGKTPFGPSGTAKVTRLSQRPRTQWRIPKPRSYARIRFKSHNLVTIAPWLRSPDRSWQTLDN